MRRYVRRITVGEGMVGGGGVLFGILVVVLVGLVAFLIAARNLAPSAYAGLWRVVYVLMGVGIWLPLLLLVFLVPASLVGSVPAWVLFFAFTAWVAVVGFAILWSGHRYANPTRWLRRDRLGWNHDPEGESWDVGKSGMWRRRVGFAVIAVSPVLGAVAAVGY